MFKSLKNLYTKLVQTHKEIYSAIGETESYLKKGPTEEDLADCIHACNEIYKLLDDSRKDLAKKTKLLEQYLFTLYTMKGDVTRRIDGHYCTARPKVSTTHRVPKFSVEYKDYKELLEFMEVPEEIIKLGILQPHYKYFGEYITKKIEQGEPIPQVKNIYSEVKITTRAKRSLEDD
jgi:hypothetical protein